MRSSGARRLGSFALAVALCAATAWPAGAESLTVTALLERSDQYHQQPVSVVGQVAELTTKLGPRNLPFYTFLLKDAQGSVSVIMQGKPELSNGDHAFVHGIFFKSRKAGRTTITNRIEATVVRQRHDAKQPFVG